MISHQNPIHIPRSLVLMEIFQRTFLSMGFATLASPQQHTRCSRAKGEPLCSTSVWRAGRRVAAAWSAPDQRTDAADGRRERDLWGKMLPSGELTFCYGKSPFLMGKSTINGHFQLLCWFTRGYWPQKGSLAKLCLFLSNIFWPGKTSQVNQQKTWFEPNTI